MTLRDRYDELLRDLKEARRLTKVDPTNPPPILFDLTDPVTGLSVLRSRISSTDREFGTAINSLAQRRSRVKVPVPSADDMAHRLDIAAEATTAPKPIMRSDRVGPEDAIPADFTTDPADVYVRTSINRRNTATQEGVLPWLDTENTLPEDRVMLHTTTNIDAVNDTGLFSRYELMEQGTPPEAIAALKAAADAGTPASSLRVYTRDGASVGFDYRAYEALTEGRSKLIHDSWANEDVPWENIARISDSNGDIWVNTTASAAPRGLGAHGVDKLISMTTDQLHAETIQGRLVFLSRVARDEMDGVDIIAHFANGYDELTGGDIATLAEIADVLGLQAYLSAGDDAWELLGRAIDRKARAAADPAQYLFDASLKLDSHLNRAMRSQMDNGLREEGFTGGVILIINKEQAARIRPEQVGIVQVAVRRSKPVILDEPAMYGVRDQVWTRIGPGGDLRDSAEAIYVYNQYGGKTVLDVQVQRGHHDQQWTDMLDYWAPQTGGAARVEIAVRPPGYQPGDVLDRVWVAGEQGTKQTPRIGPDQFELQAHSDDVFVIDRRIDGEPLATDAEALLRQLRQVSDENGNPVPGYQKRYDEIVHETNRLRDESLNPDPVTSMEDIPEEPAGMTRNLRERIRARTGRAADEFWDPVPGKETKMDRLTTQMQREEFPRVMAGTGLEKVFVNMGIPEQARADFLVVDRDLLERWQASGSPDDFQKLIEHAGGVEDRLALDRFYASEEWDVISGLWRLNLKGASEEAFGVHFFDQYRSPLLRGMNHPVLGVYPAAWAIKTAREWAKFMFDNRMFGVDLRLGMTPAVAVANITRSQQIAFAQQNPEYEGTLEEFMQEGPLGSTIFIFNLLMPGDWSALPFPLSRTLREILRNPTAIDPGDLLAKNVQYMGVTRDVRLGWEALNEIKDLAFPPEPESNLPRPKTWSSAPKRSTPKWYDVPTR